MDRGGVKPVTEYKLESSESARRVQLRDGDDTAERVELHRALDRATQTGSREYGTPALAGRVL